MYELVELLMAAGAALAAGLVIGGFAGRSFSSDTQKSREMQKQLDRVTQEQKDYQHEVAEHFTDTAKLLRNMAESYRDVHNHLATGADTVAVACPFCLVMLSDGVASSESDMKVLDISEILADRVKSS